MAQPRVLTSLTGNGTREPAVAPPVLQSEAEVGARLGLDRPMVTLAEGIELQPPTGGNVPNFGTSFDGVGNLTSPFPPDGALAADRSQALTTYPAECNPSSICAALH